MKRLYGLLVRLGGAIVGAGLPLVLVLMAGCSITPFASGWQIVLASLGLLLFACGDLIVGTARRRSYASYGTAEWPGLSCLLLSCGLIGVPLVAFALPAWRGPAQTARIAQLQPEDADMLLMHWTAFGTIADAPKQQTRASVLVESQSFTGLIQGCRIPCGTPGMVQIAPLDWQYACTFEISGNPVRISLSPEFGDWSVPTTQKARWPSWLAAYPANRKGSMELREGLSSLHSVELQSNVSTTESWQQQPIIIMPLSGQDRAARWGSYAVKSWRPAALSMPTSEPSAYLIARPDLAMRQPMAWLTVGSSAAVIELASSPDDQFDVFGEGGRQTLGLHWLTTTGRLFDPGTASQTWLWTNQRPGRLSSQSIVEFVSNPSLPATFSIAHDFGFAAVWVLAIGAIVAQLAGTFIRRRPTTESL